jgi:CRISPR-associated protein Csb2
VPVIRDVSRRVVSVGKGEDLAVLDASDVEPPADAVRWQPASSGASLEVPEAGCLDVCDAVFARDLNELPLPAAGVRAVTYASDARGADREVPTFVLGLWRNGKRRSWDARLLRQVVGPVRHLLDEIRSEVVDVLVRGPSERPAMEALVRRVLVGHDKSDKPISEPHLAILPLPSVLGPCPDGRVRRIALADFGANDDSTRRAIVETAQVLLHGRELLDNGRGTGIVLDTEPDGQWVRAITKRSCTWATVTPLVQQAKELTGDEWRHLVEARRNTEREPAKAAARELHLRKRRLELIERSVRQAMVGQEARIESIEIVPGGPLAGVHVAIQYRASGYLGETPKLHVRVTFDRPVAGPLAIGRGRHVGFGVLWPVDHTR